MLLANVPTEKRFLWFFDRNLQSNLVWQEYWSGGSVSYNGFLFDIPLDTSIPYADDYYRLFASASYDAYQLDQLMSLSVVDKNLYGNEEIILQPSLNGGSAKIRYYKFGYTEEQEIGQILEDLGNHISNKNSLTQTDYFIPYNYETDYNQIINSPYFTDFNDKNENLVKVITRAELVTKIVHLNNTQQRIKISELEPLATQQLGFNPILIHSLVITSDSPYTIPPILLYTSADDIRNDSFKQIFPIFNIETISSKSLTNLRDSTIAYNCPFALANHLTSNLIKEPLKNQFAIKIIRPNNDDINYGIALANAYIGKFLGQYEHNQFNALVQTIELSPSRATVQQARVDILHLNHYMSCLQVFGYSAMVKSFFTTKTYNLSWTTQIHQQAPFFVNVASVSETINIDQNAGLAWFYSDTERANILNIINSNDYPDFYQYKEDFYNTFDNMGIVQMIEEIHACLGAGEYSYNNGSPYYMHIARRLDWLAKAYGVAFNPDGSVISVKQRQNISFASDPNTGQFTANIPDGWLRGQFADRVDNNIDHMGIVYQNRCNDYQNWDDTDPSNNIYKQGDLVLCDNFLQLFESYLEDLDKGLNWQEMGAGVLPSPDGSRFCAISGLGTLVAENAYMIGNLSNNIYQTHVLSMKNYHCLLEILKGLGLSVTNTVLEVDLPEGDTNDPTKGSVMMPSITDDTPNITQQNFNILANLALILGAIAQDYTED